MDPDLNGLQGRWAVKVLEIDGREIPAPMFAGAALEIIGDRFVSHGMGAEYAGVVAISSEPRPAELDMRFDSGPEKGNTNLAIFELDGDVLTLCIATRGTVRPSAFSSPSGGGIALEILHRVK
jgi:uncharacterized protein (TIGR03067 family)